MKVREVLFELGWKKIGESGAKKKEVKEEE